MGKAIGAFSELGWEKVPNWECILVHRKQGLFLSIYVDDIKMAGKKQNMSPLWKNLRKLVDLREPTAFLDHIYFGCTQREWKPNETIIEQFSMMFESRISAGAPEKLHGWEKPHAKTVAWSYDMESHAKKGAFKDVVHWQTKRQQQHKFSTLSQTLLATLRIQNRLQVEFCAFSEVEHSFPLVGCARNKR